LLDARVHKNVQGALTADQKRALRTVIATIKQEAR